MKNELKWLLFLAIISGALGWFSYGYFAGEVLIWALPVYCLLALIFTVNGDNIIEAIIVLLLFGVFAYLLNPLLSERYGLIGWVPSIYITLALSKLSFALAKNGLFGNDKFS